MRAVNDIRPATDIDRVAESPVGAIPESGLELTILMPCLNEAETLAACIDKARGFLARAGIAGEVLISDNGSKDGSVDIAERHGARVVHAPVRGYGGALWYGINHARGRYVIMGDADDSYDFSRLDAFLEKLREGHDLVIGNRFAGGIAPGAMPPLHRYLGNPVLSFLGRLFFSTGVRDFHCGLRGFRRDRILALGLKTTGMEFASEMVVRSSLQGLQLAEVPTTLAKDGRSRPPHLRTWRDGWRHLRFLLLLSPRWLFLYPGALIFGVGMVLAFALLQGPVAISPRVTLDVHSLIVACLAMLAGAQCVSFGVIAERYATARGYLPGNGFLKRFGHLLTLERILPVGTAIFLAGLGGLAYSVSIWAGAAFGPLEYGGLIRLLTLSCTFVALGLQVVFTAFLSAFFDIT